MKITFLYGGYGTHEKREEIKWPDGAPLPRAGELVNIELRGKEVIDGTVTRVSHCLRFVGNLEIWIKVE